MITETYNTNMLPDEADPQIFTLDGVTYRADADGVLIPIVAEGFRIDSDERADWLLEKLLIAKTKNANYAAMAKSAKARHDGLLARFEGELAQYAKSQLQGKEKTACFGLGKVSFKTVKGGDIGVKDKEKALDLVKLLKFETGIKVTEEFQIGKLSDADIG